MGTPREKGFKELALQTDESKKGTLVNGKRG